MQLRLLFDALAPTAPATPPASNPGTLMFVRNPRARRYILRVLPDGTARITIPRRGSRREAERFVNSQQRWIEQQRRKRAELQARPGAAPADPHTMLFRGTPIALVRATDGSPDGASKRPVVQFGDQRLPMRSATEDPRAAVMLYLRRVAAEELPARLRELAARHQLTVTRVMIRNQRARWGSCSTDGRISLNWRLVQMPDRVRDYILLHELMHLREPNHSRRFWRHVAAVCPDFQECRRWLRAHESLLALRDVT